MIGTPLRRREDEALVTGRATFAADLARDCLHLAVIRSPLPRARLVSIGLAEVRRRPGVLAAWTAADLPELGTLPGFPMEEAKLRPRPVLATGEARYAGEPLGVVVAETRYLAEDAALAADLELDPVDASAEPEAGELAGRLRRAFGDVQAAFAGAAATVSARLVLNRVSGAYIEPRSAFAAPDGDGVRVNTSTQWAHGVRDAVAASLGLEKAQVRVLAPWVGGAFGAKGMPYPEEVLVAAAAQRLRRPVGWVAGRSEDMLASAQSHGTVLDLELAAEADGRLRGVRGRVVHPIGAYAGSGPGQADNICSHLFSCYRLPALDVEIELVYTNTPPTGFIRGGGREVGVFATERLLDRLAGQIGSDPLQVRARNLLRVDELPHDSGYRTSRGDFSVDSGDFHGLLAAAAKALDERLQPPPRPHVSAGTGLACFAESTGMGAAETARVRMAPTGEVTVLVGTTPQGQGHATSAAQIAAQTLGWPVERVTIVCGDSAAVPFSRNTSASRSTVEMGNAVAVACAAARRQLVEIAAEHLESEPDDVLLDPGRISLRSVPEARVSLADLIPNGLECAETYEPRGTRPYASGCAAARVQVDLETGAITVADFVLAHDVGRAVNPTIVEGQAHGGYAHGLGYALLEEVVYDAQSTPLTSSFLDYTIAAAPEVSTVPHVIELDTPSPQNPQGFRGAGEGATIPVAAAVASAVDDALRRAGNDAFVTQLPITPERVYRMLNHPTEETA